MSSVFLALGSNIDPEANLQAAAKRLRTLWPKIEFSHVYRTAPAEVTDQPEFLNAVALIEIEESPQEIVEKLHAIEKELKKDPPYRFGPRTIDLDLLLYGRMCLSEPANQQTSKLIIPHPRMHERRFVLEPLLELMDDAERHPLMPETFGELLNAVASQKSKRIGLVL